MNSRAEPLLQFAFNYELRIERLIIFDAVVSYYKENELCHIRSEIQVIVLPNEMVMHVIEFQNPVYRRADKYSTAEYYFSYRQGRSLTIQDENNLLLEIIPSD